MSTTLKVRKVGNSLGTILPKEVVKKLHVEEGDELYVVETEEGVIITPYDPNFETAMKAARRFMDEHPNALRELAK